MKKSVIVLIGFLLVFLLFLLDLAMGSVSIPLGKVVDILMGEESKKSWEYIVLNFRLPKALTAILTGAGISVAGLQMQTLFKNPLAGPSVLGISHGASLGVAIFVLSSTTMFGAVKNLQESMGSWGLILFAVLGSLMVLFCVLIASSKLSDSISVLIVGIMFGFITGSIVSILQYYSDPELIQNFLIWTFGSLSGVAWSQMKVMGPIVLVSLVTCLMYSKQMNALLLGENYATGVGIHVTRVRIMLIVTTSILAGTLTAFTGPIAFIGVAVPHLARLLFKTSNHKTLIPATMLCGVIIMLVCDIVSQIPGSESTLPVNSITALFGAPVIIAIIVKNGKMKGAF
ncbi:MAG: iron ABC transporter permease [Carboxylicivirga sp.]|jgi:iron complex transport system permease protein|nr:iron ABC transporter permease [Carboxylicivirga sp.]